MLSIYPCAGLGALDRRDASDEHFRHTLGGSKLPTYIEQASFTWSRLPVSVVAV